MMQSRYRRLKWMVLLLGFHLHGGIPATTRCRCCLFRGILHTRGGMFALLALVAGASWAPVSWTAPRWAVIPLSFSFPSFNHLTVLSAFTLLLGPGSISRPSSSRWWTVCVFLITFLLLSLDLTTGSGLSWASISPGWTPSIFYTISTSLVLGWILLHSIFILGTGWCASGAAVTSSWAAVVIAPGARWSSLLVEVVVLVFRLPILLLLILSVSRSWIPRASISSILAPFYR